MTPPSSYFQHIDGGLYRFITEARHADNAQPVIVYEHLWPFEPGIWVRNAVEFQQRFTPIDAAIVQAQMQGNRQAAQQTVTAAKAARRARQTST
ncbi:hypothetical protein HNQ59_000194 [Chitinivorax tropicus]|uniref:DUF1653 domain-containing protein n=1 Tax=Chitinivorax tropicus TaxID=714531 RepID=A0A840MJR0_9PROT|nr:DUF1653 domain-containing protein [Chitinivorax tropicus]MBB5016932.1 hypothetical protein [Chitinivorax tropicus]